MENPESPLTDPKTKRILLVEDDDSLRGLLEMGTKQEGFQVATAPNGAEALRMLPGFDPDLVVTDLMMPEKGGYELIRQLQGTEHGAVPVIVITAKRMDHSTAALLQQESNVLKVLAKPISMNSFTLALHQVLHTQPIKTERSRGINDRPAS